MVQSPNSLRITISFFLAKETELIRKVKSSACGCRTSERHVRGQPRGVTCTPPWVPAALAQPPCLHSQDSSLVDRVLPHTPRTTLPLLPVTFEITGQGTITACLRQSFRQLLKKGWTWGSRGVKMPTHTLMAKEAICV